MKIKIHSEHKDTKMHTLTFYRVKDGESNDGFVIIDQLVLLTKTPPPQNLDVEASHTYCRFLNVNVICDDANFQALSNWKREGDNCIVYHDDVLVMSDFFNSGRQDLRRAFSIT